MKYLNFEAVINLIEQGGFGSYLVYDSQGGELLFGSHITDQDNKDILQMPTPKLIEDLRTKIDLFGFGNFKILLKKNNKTVNSNAVVYRFQISPEGKQAQPQMNGLGSMEGLEGIISKRVSEQTELIKKELQRDQEMAELRRQLEEAKNGKANDYDGFIDIAKMGLGFLVAKTSPESMGAIQAMLGYDSESQEAAKPTAFNRTD